MAPNAAWDRDGFCGLHLALSKLSDAMRTTVCATFGLLRPREALESRPLVPASWFTRRGSTGSRSERHPETGQGRSRLRCPRNGQAVDAMRVNLIHQATGRPETGAWEGGEVVLPARIPANEAAAACAIDSRA